MLPRKSKKNQRVYLYKINGVYEHEVWGNKKEFKKYLKRYKRNFDFNNEGILIMETYQLIDEEII